MKRIFTVLLFLTTATFLHAEEYSIQVNAEDQPNTWTLESIVGDVTAGLKTDREKAIALHNFGMKHVLHFVGPYDHGTWLYDAMKIIGVYGYGLCGNNSSTMCALYDIAGIKARRRFLTGHVVPEVWFEGGWHYIDTDMYGYVVKPDGGIASVDELLADPMLFEKNSRQPDPFFPFDPMETMRNAFMNTEGHTDCHPFHKAHLMNLQLRTWESVACYYRPQGRFYIAQGQMQKKLSEQYPDYWVVGPIRSASLAWTDEDPAGYGNGHFVYEPDLTSDIFLSENKNHEGLRTEKQRGFPQLVATTKGQKASLTLEIKTPWVVAGLQNDLTNFDDNTDGAVVSGAFWRMEESDEARLMVSADRGQHWTTVWENRWLGRVPFQVDLTRYVNGGYGYLVKFECVDNSGSGKSGFSDLKVETWTELSSMFLPHLVKGENKLNLSVSPQSARIIECHWENDDNLPAQSLENFSAPGSGLKLVNSNLPGAVVFGTAASGLVDQARIAIAAELLEGGSREQFKALLYLSENKGADWTLLETFTIDPEHDQTGVDFNYVLSGKSVLGESARFKLEVFGGNLNAITVNSLERVSPVRPSTLVVTHGWTEGESSKSVSWTFKPETLDNGAYTVDVEGAGKLVNRYLKIESLPVE